MKTIAGKKIVIVGATSGIGLEVARLLAARGAVLGLAGRNIEPLRPLEEQYGRGRILTASIDVTATDAPVRLAALVRDLGGMDIYLHAAGIARDNPDMLAAPDMKVIDTNVTGFTRMMTAVLAIYRILGGRGRIAAITSIAGSRGIASMASYCASKSYERVYMQAMSQYVRRRGMKVKVTDLRPGWVSTPLLAQGGRYPLMVSAERAAALIVEALVKAPHVAYIPERWRWVGMAWHMLPAWLWDRFPYAPPLSGR